MVDVLLLILFFTMQRFVQWVDQLRDTLGARISYVALSTRKCCYVKDRCYLLIFLGCVKHELHCELCSDAQTKLQRYLQSLSTIVSNLFEL